MSVKLITDVLRTQTVRTQLGVIDVIVKKATKELELLTALVSQPKAKRFLFCKILRINDWNKIDVLLLFLLVTQLIMALPVDLGRLG